MTKFGQFCLRWLAAGVFATSLTACGSTAPQPDVKPTAAGMACRLSTKWDGIEHCTEFFPGDRPIRLPADPSGEQRYGAVKRAGTAFYTRGGDIPIAAALRDQLGEAVTDVPARRAGYPNTVYLGTITNGEVTAVEPVVEIDENALLRAVFAGRAMEGTIGALAGPDDYSSTKTLPVRVEFGANPADGKLAGRIVNAAAGVRGADGRCIAQLAGAEGDPLTGDYTADIQLQRSPSMHGGFNDEMVLLWKESSNMGVQFYPSVATLLGGDPLEKRWSTTLHGNPAVGPAVNLHLVTGGGETC